MRSAQQEKLRMIPASRVFHLLVTFLLAGFLPVLAAASSRLLHRSADGWRVLFDPQSSILECDHVQLGFRLSGKLSFTLGKPAQQREWRVELGRDQASGRLAVVDENDDVQGYVNLGIDGDRLWMRVNHRPPQLYAGCLRYLPTIHAPTSAFACRTRMAAASPVVQMASGSADSLLNDSLFVPERDLAVRLHGENVVLASEEVSAGRPPRFRAELTASVSREDVSTISVEIVRDYYRSRFVPNYRLIDRRRCPTAPTGWMSWNVYFDTAGEKENLDEARIGAKYLKPFGLEIWSIESWQENSPRLPVSDFHNLGLRASSEKFPHGMKWLAEQIRALGFRPGVWTVPWGTGDAKFYEEHRDWFLHGRDGKPLSNWNGKFVVDPSLPQVRREMERTHRVMASDWGYEFFKVDGMSGRGPGYSAHFFERPEIRALFRHKGENVYGRCLEALRRGMGPDTIFLACQGHYTGSEVAFADAARLGADIVEPNHPPHWANYLNQARVSLSQLFTHNLIWYNDPDTLLVGESAPINEARLATTVVALPGQLTFFGDKLAGLPPARMRLLQQTLPVCDVHPLDLFPIDDLKSVWDLKVRRSFGAWDVVSLFNWEEHSRRIDLSFPVLGLPGGKEYLLFDFWSQKFLGCHAGGYSAELKPHSNLLLAVHERLERPQFLSTDRHVSQGGVELKGKEWNPQTGELTTVFSLVAGDPLTASFHVPPNYRLARVECEGALVEEAAPQSNPVARFTLQRPTSGEAKLGLRFEVIPPTPTAR